MRFAILMIIMIGIIISPAKALELQAPDVPRSGVEYMPDDEGSFADRLLDLVHNVVEESELELSSAVTTGMGVICIVLLVALLQCFQKDVKGTAEYAGILAVSVSLFSGTKTMIQLGGKTISELSEYGKLLFPVMTAALAAQGGIGTSAAIYAGATAFSSLASVVISGVLLPMVYAYLAFAIANSAIGEDTLKNIRDLLKQVISWALKILLTVFTTYISITGFVSGTIDAAALKATKVTISSFVPVVGGILSDASEAILVSVGVAKNAAGIYGILAILAVFLKPFLRIGVHYLLLKLVSGVCGIFGTKRISNLVGDYSVAMGLILAMTGTVCILLLIATVCFMKGIG